MIENLVAGAGWCLIAAAWWVIVAGGVKTASLFMPKTGGDAPGESLLASAKACHGY